MKAKKIGALLLAGVMAASMVSATSVSAADAKRVCFVARASADTFAAWLTTEIKKQAENYDDIDRLKTYRTFLDLLILCHDQSPPFVRLILGSATL